MIERDLDDLLNARPFRPFFLRTASGRELPVSRPESLGRLPGGRTIVVSQECGVYDLVDMVLVEGVRVDVAQGGWGGHVGRPEHD